ncbi:tyrosine-type recombinase/integrase [Urechidicola croceus]|uniref:Integrase n=1 Tax=Urechidicola croceus TaxID=1850246 RepID=A0A1D8P888_9FLAO|nr:site-specific integrase [Urechidicola croceus]AOW20786.1 integrase [Urechidicola croceus]
MPSLLPLLSRVHNSVHNFRMKLNYSEPKIYSGGVDISKWSSLSKSEQKSALLKKWYLYYSFRDPNTGDLKRQTNIKGNANKFSDKRNRYNYLKSLQRSLIEVLEAGFNPYVDNSELEEKMFGDIISENQNKNTSKKIKEIAVQPKDVQCTIKKAFAKGLRLKERVMNKNSFTKYKSRILRFEKWLELKAIEKQEITQIDKKLVIEYLNHVLENSSPRNRNNTRADISSLFQILEDNELIRENFVKKINVLKSVPKRNKTYTPTLQNEIYEYLEKKDSHLLLFVKFISYNFLRPIEVCRLRIEDIDVVDRKIYVKAKNSPVKIKIIPEILLKELPDLKEKDPKDFLFIQNGVGGNWAIEETNKRDYFTKKFKQVKNHFGLGKEYGLYSFRHTFITRLYRELRQENSPFEAKSKLMLITGHTTMTALDKYLRDIDAELPEDYSKLFG